jgi:ATP-binding cassette, subfamily C (CFTR/MRP), member 1
MATVRGGMITLIFSKMVKLPTDKFNESGAVSLMGNDVETLAERFHLMLTESWSNVIQLALAIWLLADQLGAVCVAPIIVGLRMSILYQ